MATRQANTVKRMLAAACLMLIMLAPAMGNPVRLWRAAHCTVCEVTARAENFYETLRLVYSVQRHFQRR